LSDNGEVPSVSGILLVLGAISMLSRPLLGKLIRSIFACYVTNGHSAVLKEPLSFFSFHRWVGLLITFLPRVVIIKIITCLVLKVIK
jgi:hypothetical protein